MAGAFLVMVGASLRLWDIMHITWNELNMDSLDLLGLVYRTKMARSGMLVAVAGDVMLGCVVEYQGMARHFLGCCMAGDPRLFGSAFMPDVLLFTCDVSAAEFRPSSCVQALEVLRDLSAQHMPQCAGVASYYTLHSCKATYLSCVSQCNLGRTDRHLHYMPETILFGVLRAQREVLRRVRVAGFLPCPLLRGVVRRCRPSLCLQLGRWAPQHLCNMFQYFGAFQVAAQDEVSVSEQPEIGDLVHVCVNLRGLDPVAEGSEVSDVDVTRAVVPSVP